jgi:hypothetical protein
MVRENFAWWKNLLEREAMFDFWVKHNIAYEPWVKNGYSEFMKNTFEGYTASHFHDQDAEYKPLKVKLQAKRK